jgi:hypothetical protein
VLLSLEAAIQRFEALKSPFIPTFLFAWRNRKGTLRELIPVRSLPCGRPLL